MIKNNRNKGLKTVIRSVRMPDILDKRIGNLALKGLTTKSAWIIRTLMREANVILPEKYNKPSVIDSSASSKEKT